MKTTILDRIYKPGHARGRLGRTAALLATLAITACTAVRLDAAVIDDFEDGVKFGPGSGAGYTNYFLWGMANGELVVRKPNPTPFPPYPGTMETYDNIYWPAPRLPDDSLEGGRTLELRMDLIHTSADDLFLMPMCGGEYEGASTLYWVFIDRNEVALVKYRYDMNDVSRTHITTFYWDVTAATFENVTVKLAFTKTNSTSLAITVKVVDKGNPRATLYERTFVDGPGQDGPVPPPDPHGYGFFTTDQGVPYPAFSFAAAGCSHAIRANPPPLEMRVDNVEYDVYHPPHLEIARATNGAALSWRLPMEEHIVVEADQLAGPWCPCPQPCTRTNDTFCLTLPCESQQKFFKLTPGTQFIDDFSGVQPTWISWLQEPPGETWRVTNGVLQVDWNQPATPGFALFPMGTNVEAVLRDFSASVNIMDWVTSGTNESIFSFAGRRNGYAAYFGGLVLNVDGVSGQVVPIIRNGSAPSDLVFGTTNYVQLPYRLQFSVVGTQISLRVLRLTTGQLIEELNAPAAPVTPLTEGPVGLYIDGRNNPGDAFTITADNYFLSWTKP